MDDVIHLPLVVEVVRINLSAARLISDGIVFHYRRVFGGKFGIYVRESCRFQGQCTRQEYSQCQQ